MRPELSTQERSVSAELSMRWRWLASARMRITKGRCSGFCGSASVRVRFVRACVDLLRERGCLGRFQVRVLLCQDVGGLWSGGADPVQVV